MIVSLAHQEVLGLRRGLLQGKSTSSRSPTAGQPASQTFAAFRRIKREHQRLSWHHDQRNRRRSAQAMSISLQSGFHVFIRPADRQPRNYRIAASPNSTRRARRRSHQPRRTCSHHDIERSDNHCRRPPPGDGPNWPKGPDADTPAIKFGSGVRHRGAKDVWHRSAGKPGVGRVRLLQQRDRPGQWARTIDPRTAARWPNIKLTTSGAQVWCRHCWQLGHAAPVPADANALSDHSPFAVICFPGPGSLVNRGSPLLRDTEVVVKIERSNDTARSARRRLPAPRAPGEDRPRRTRAHPSLGPPVPLQSMRCRVA